MLSIKKYSMLFNLLLITNICNTTTASQVSLIQALELTQLLPHKKNLCPKSDRPVLNYILETSNTPEELLAQLKKYKFTQNEIRSLCLRIKTAHKLTPEIISQLPQLTPEIISQLPQGKSFQKEHLYPKSDRPLLNYILETSNTPEELLAQLQKYNFTRAEILVSCQKVKTSQKITPEIMSQLPEGEL